MFSLFDVFAKRINDQMADYAAAQADMVSRAWAAWLGPCQTAQPVRVTADCRAAGARRPHSRAPQRHGAF